MRTHIRAAIEVGHQRIAVVCGAWHAPALIEDSLESTRRDDKKLLSALPKPTKVSATWVPWTYDRLDFASGYGAGQTGGTISVLGDNVGIMSGALIDANGDAGGGTVKIGGDFHGAGATPTALNAYIDSNSLIMANANSTGNGGHVTVWSDNATQFLGNIMAEGGEQSGNGGYVETSGHGTLDAEGYVDLTAPKGAMGTWLLDPTNITIDGGVTPAFNNSGGVTDGTQVNLSSALQLWLDASNASSITLSYNDLSTTANGSMGANSITVGNAASFVVGERIQIGTSASELASVNDISNIYTITAISGNIITLDANLSSAASAVEVYGGYVSQINDLSGNHNNALQATAGDMPLWISNGQNGQGVLQFNGSTYLDGAASVTGNSLSAYSTFSMSDASGPWARILSLANGAGQQDYSSTSSASALIRDNGSENLISYRNGPLSLAGFTFFTPTIGGTQYDGTNNTTSVNGAAGASVTSGGNFGVTVYRVGLDTGDGGGGNYAGNIYDVMLYNTVLSTNAQALVNQYQSAKWGAALTGPGVIGSEAGLTGAEAQQAMASTQAGATTDGYSVFATSYLTRLSQTSDIILQAGNNINLDLQGNTLSLAAGKNITLTAGNHIVTDSAGEISTSQSSGTGGNITFNATNGIVFNNAFTLNSGGGNINLNNNVTLGAALTANAGTGALTFGGTVNGGYDLTATANSFSFNGALGGGTALADVSITSADALTLPLISASTIFVQTSGASSNLTIGSGSGLTASGSGDAVTLASGENFINNEGSDAINLTGSGRWLIYSATPGADTFGNLNSSNTAVWDAAYGGTITQSGNRYVFSYQPTLNFTSISDSKTYGTDATAAVASDYNVNGLEAAMNNVYLADTNTTAFSGSPDVTSAGSATTATVVGGPYIIDIASGALAAVDGYTLGSYTSSGHLTVNTAPLTITAESQSVAYGTAVPTTTLSYNGFVDSQDNTALTTQPTITSTKSGIVLPGIYTSNYVPSGAADSNYDISYVDGDLAITGTVPVATTANSLPSTVVAASQNVPVYASPGIPSNNPIAVANDMAVISDAQSKPQSASANYTGNGAANVNTPVLSMFGGILTIDPALISKFKLGYLKNKS